MLGLKRNEIESKYLIKFICFVFGCRYWLMFLFVIFCNLLFLFINFKINYEIGIK